MTFNTTRGFVAFLILFFVVNIAVTLWAMNTDTGRALLCTGRVDAVTVGC